MSSTLALLQRLTPAASIIHVGAGMGQGELHEWRSWGVPNALLVDAAPDRMTWTEPLIAANSGWQVATAVLGDTDNVVTFHKTTNPAEDGLVPAQPLRVLWQNLAESDSQQLHAQRLDTLLASTWRPKARRSDVWLLVDCFPAGLILRGSVNTLEECNVVCVRALLKRLDGVHGADIEEIDALMKSQGFKWIDTQPTLHPAIGHAVFSRDWPSSLRALSGRVATALDSEAAAKADLLARQLLEEETKQSVAAQIGDLTERVNQLTEALALESAASRDAEAKKDAAIKAKLEARVAVDSLVQERDRLADEIRKESTEKSDAIAKLQALLAENEELIAVKAAYESAGAVLAQERDAAVAEKSNALIQKDLETEAKASALAQLAKEIEARRQAFSQLDKVTAEVRNLQALLSVRDEEREALKQKIAQLESAHSDRVSVVQRQREEIMHAEAKIRSIKGMLSRESGA